jgi:hypothetical protein
VYTPYTTIYTIHINLFSTILIAYISRRSNDFIVGTFLDRYPGNVADSPRLARRPYEVAIHAPVGLLGAEEKTLQGE